MRRQCFRALMHAYTMQVFGRLTILSNVHRDLSSAFALSRRDLVVLFSDLSGTCQLSYHSGCQPGRTSLVEHDLYFDTQYA